MSRIQLLLKRLRHQRSEAALLKRANRALQDEIRSLKGELDEANAARERQRALYDQIFAYEVRLDNDPRDMGQLRRCTLQLSVRALRHIRDIKPMIQDVAIQLCRQIQL